MRAVRVVFPLCVTLMGLIGEQCGWFSRSVNACQYESSAGDFPALRDPDGFDFALVIVVEIL